MEKREISLDMYDRPNFPITDLAEKIIELEDASEEERNAYIKEMHEKGAIGQRRISVVKNQEGEAEIKLSDSKGKSRIRLAVDANDVPKIEILDQEGEIVYRLP